LHRPYKSNAYGNRGGKKAVYHRSVHGLMDMPRVLLVEDDPEVRLLVEHILLDADYEVDSVETLEAGRRALRRRAYDLVIADGRLADGTGMELADDARERTTPTLIMTGYAFVLAASGVDLGQYDVLLKPISPEELLASVAKTLSAPN
jgi:two-component system, NtrC family, response regulator HydG